MKNVCWVVPVREGMTEAVRDYCHSMENDRRAEYERSQNEIGLTSEQFFLWESEMGAFIILYMEGDLPEALKAWTEHTGEFETWGKTQWATFSDPGHWPEPLWAEPGTADLPELLSSYSKATQ
jgi:hypothetical protein